MVEGHVDGSRADSPEPSSNRSAAYRPTGSGMVATIWRGRREHLRQFSERRLRALSRTKRFSKPSRLAVGRFSCARVVLIAVLLNEVRGLIVAVFMSKAMGWW